MTHAKLGHKERLCGNLLFLILWKCKNKSTNGFDDIVPSYVDSVSIVWAIHVHADFRKDISCIVKLLANF